MSVINEVYKYKSLVLLSIENYVNYRKDFFKFPHGFARFLLKDYWPRAGVRNLKDFLFPNMDNVL